MKPVKKTGPLPGLQESEPARQREIGSAPSDPFVALGKVTALTRKDQNGNTGDGGGNQGWVYKQSS
jgi:hypothetical protein